MEGGLQEMKQSLLHVSTLPSVPLFILITHINLLRIKKVNKMPFKVQFITKRVQFQV